MEFDLIEKIEKLVNKSNLDINIISVDHEKYINKIKPQKTHQTFSNLASLLQCFELGKKYGPIDITMINIGAYNFKPMFDKSDFGKRIHSSEGFSGFKF